MSKAKKKLKIKGLALKIKGLAKKKIDKQRVKAGRLISVENTKRRTNGAMEYNSLWVEDTDGQNERCWFLTLKDVEMLEYRSQRNKEDWTKKGLITDILD